MEDAGAGGGEWGKNRGEEQEGSQKQMGCLQIVASLPPPLTPLVAEKQACYLWALAVNHCSDATVSFWYVPKIGKEQHFPENK